ncbi:DUF177 domain-containing protein [Planomicrobium sp. YIM 101495]|uniref:YceD family protein n=1 Tax=Planomicrobium sp. YIM 101495 TaxID=2665160 RepID=UPI0012B99683|nr:YceD family protein [Planomicrobium sp. YIM 101495]MTD30342.1 hypothetical protein [Planomicrobium sp. YIM 101495]
MKIAVQQLQKYQKDGMPIDETVLLDSIKERSNDVRSISPVQVTGLCTIGSKNMTCQLHLSGTLILPCARTWEDVEYPIDIETVEVYDWSGMAVEGANENVHAVTGDVIDLTPLLEELIMLEIPMQVYKEGADQAEIKGGKDWSYSTDEQLKAEKEEAQKKPDPRLAELAKYFDQLDE